MPRRARRVDSKRDPKIRIDRFHANVAGLHEFLTYDKEKTYERVIAIARDLAVVDAHALLLFNEEGMLQEARGDAPVLLTGLAGLNLQELSMDQGGEFLVEEVNEKTSHPLAPVGGKVRSFVTVPLIAKSRALGLLFLGSFEPRAFDPEEVELFFTLGTHLAVSLENIRHFEEAEEKIKVLEALRTTQEALSLSGNLDEVAARIADEAAKTFETRWVGVFIEDEKSKNFVLRVFDGGLPRRRELPADHERIEELFVPSHGGRGIFFEPGEGGPLAAILPSKCRLYASPFGRSGIAAGGRGILLFAFDRLTDDKASLLGIFKEHAGTLLSNALLIERLRRGTEELERQSLQVQEYAGSIRKMNQDLERRIAELSALYRIGRTLTAEVELDAILEKILGEAVSLSQSEYGTVHLVRGMELHAVVAKGYAQRNRLSFRVGEGVAGKVAESGKPKLLARASDDEDYVQLLGGMSGQESMLCVPLKHRDEVVGTISLSRPPSVGPFETTDQELITALANSATGAIRRAQSFEELETFFEATLASFATAVDMRDPYTANHSARVRNFSILIAERMNLSPSETEIVGRAALLHDIGKIGIPNEILYKPEKLTPEEYEIIKQHVLYGEKILKPIARLAEEARLVRHHHEHWAGTGYPDGLVGPEIPLGSSIIGVADAFDTMTSDRPYRKALPNRVAVAELQRHAGKQFDPMVVGAFVSIAENLSGAGATEAPAPAKPRLLGFTGGE